VQGEKVTKPKPWYTRLVEAFELGRDFAHSVEARKNRNSAKKLFKWSALYLPQSSVAVGGSEH
jgi:hypothetical protein